MATLPRVFIDGHAGTTGLRIRDWLAGREDIALVSIPEDQRKDPAARREYLRDADLVILCLPDDSAREAVELIGDRPTRVIDASTGIDTSLRSRNSMSGRTSNTGCVTANSAPASTLYLKRRCS